MTRETIAHIQRDATSFVGGASWRGRWGLRVSIASWWTQDEHIDRAAESILGAWRTVRGAG
jgi:glutamate/tyrosine decarboxylase-like PLP-dependent enzyme